MMGFGCYDCGAGFVGYDGYADGECDGGDGGYDGYADGECDGGADNDIDCEGRALVSLLAGTLLFYAV